MPRENRRPKDVPPEWEDFFFLFSRFEYALKEVGFLLNSNPQAKAEPNWDWFANSIRLDFFKTIQTNPSIEKFCAMPPKQQVVGVKSRLEWREVDPVLDNASLFLALRRLRNNLFHGGKSGDPFGERSRQLLQAGIEIIHFALDEHKVLERRFEQGY